MDNITFIMITYLLIHSFNIFIEYASKIKIKDND